MAGGAAGWLVVAMATGLSGLGDAALGLGVLAGACLMVLIGAMAHAAVGAPGEEPATRARAGEASGTRAEAAGARAEASVLGQRRLVLGREPASAACCGEHLLGVAIRRGRGATPS